MRMKFFGLLVLAGIGLGGCVYVPPGPVYVAPRPYYYGRPYYRPYYGY